ncbi:MAG TPA: VWA domain-containing protein [Vicinamibacterales bacterium]|nr:VWA domain-containing protein [Vicinamibacterales bacterium]
MAACGALRAAAICLLAAELAGAQTVSPPAEAQSPPRFTSSVDLVSVAAVVRDRRGRFVPDLSREDFEVVEGGERRPIVGFEFEKDGPVRLALLIDISGSMRVGTKVADAKQTARHLLGALRPADRAALFTFDTGLDRVHDFTADFGAVDRSLEIVQPPYGQTSLYDAIAQTARMVAGKDGSGSRAQRSALVVVTDGIDTKSRLTPGQVSGIASNIDVPVYIIAVMSPIDDPRNADDDRASSSVLVSSALRDLARWTGGELFTSSTPAHASVAARQLIAEMRNQYLLAFEASTREGWRPLEVRARHRDHVVRARSGYTAGGGRTSPSMN